MNTETKTLETSLSKKDKNNMMKGGSALVALSAFVPNPNHAVAQTFTANFSALAKITTAIQVAQISNIDFGKFINVAGGKFTMSTAGAVTPSSAGVGTHIGSAAQGKFKITNAPENVNLELAVVALGAGIQMTDGGNTITVTKLTFADVAQITTGRTLTSGNTSTNIKIGTGLLGGGFTIPFGGVLAVGAGDPAGSYSGTFAITLTLP